MLQKYLKKLLATILISCLFLSGCKAELSPQNQTTLESTGDFTETETIGKTYHVTEHQLDITHQMFPKFTSLQAFKEILYFENLSDSKPSIYKMDLTEETPPEQLPITFADSDVLLNFVVDEAGNVYCFLQTGEGFYSFQSYDKEGKLLVQQDISQLVSTNQEYFFLDHLMLDSKGIIYGSQENSIWMFRSDGTFLGTVEIPAPPILDMAIGMDGIPYVTYYANHYEVTLAAIDTENCRLKNPVSIPGTGRLFTGTQEDLLTYDSQYLYEISTDTGESTVVLDLMQHYIDSAPICLLWGTSDAALHILTWQVASDNLSDVTMKYLTLIETSSLSDSFDAQQKETIHIIAPGSSGDPDFVNFIMEFNKQSEKYTVSYEAMDFADEQALSTYLNTRLVSQDCPDLILTGYYYYQLFAEANVLTDLTPYLSRSRSVAKDDYLDSVIESFETEDSLYGIPLGFYIKSLVGRKSQINSIQSGMTANDFLDFLEKHPDAKFERDGEPLGLLRFCLKFNLDNFIDFEKNICHFQDAPFRTLMTRINRLGGSHYTEWDAWDETIESGEIVLPELSLSNFYTLAGHAYDYEGDLTLLGYPSSEGTIRCELIPSHAMSILGNSSHKDGAWEFMEYYLENYKAPSTFPSTKKEFQEALETATTKQYKRDVNGKKVESPVSHHFYHMDLMPIYALSKKEAEHIVTAVEGAKPVSKEIETILQMIWEESQGYYYGSKSLDEVLAVIQSRVQLYLDENL